MSALHLQENENAGKLEFDVMIVACGPTKQGLVCAVTVRQPVQSWTVIRSHEEFVALGRALSSILPPTLAPCPAVAVVAENDMSTLVKTRNDLQQWLTDVLLHPDTRESPDFRNFLTYGANLIPPQYHSVSWSQFGSILPPPRPAAVNPALDDMDMHMDDLFGAGDDGSDDNDEDEDYVPSASVRYKPTDEAVTDEDEMEIMDLAGEIEMIEDVGSLAQSLGASHLGRSLQLQAEMKRPQAVNAVGPVQGLQIGGGASNQGQQAGGIGNAMARAGTQALETNTNTAFNAKPMQSAPRLDSFKLIKVIGKGSFGKLDFCGF